MAVDTFAEHTEPDPGPDNRILKTLANAALERWLQGPARRDGAQARAARQQAAGTLQRHLDGLWQVLLPRALGPAGPEGPGRAAWAAALERVIRRRFPVS